MKRLILLCLCLSLLTLLCGCNGTIQHDFQENNQTGETAMENVEMTAWEIRIMTAVYGDESRMQAGNLLDYQLEALQQLRAGNTYLEEKYNDARLEILTFAPANKFNPSAQFLLEDSDGATYSLTVTPTENGYSCADNYYGALIRESYDEYVNKVLAGEGFDVASYTSFSALLGKEVGANTIVNEFLSIAPKASRVTHLFIMATVDTAAAKDGMQAALEENGLYGTYVLYLVPVDEFSSVETMENNRNTWEYVTFNCFNIR